uniref:Arginine vasopressin-induced protein 1 n=1 Tax=Mola mola TaxID=94237 RepID=A0A3Q3WMU8_MOLML
MDTRPAAPPSSVAPGPSSSLWQLAKRRSRKAASGNIFSNVNLWQLQRLFRVAGDQDAEQRAQLVWGHRDEAELDPPRYNSPGATGRETGARPVLTESQGPAGTFERPVRSSSGLRRGGENDPERYLHRILH